MKANKYCFILITLVTSVFASSQSRLDVNSRVVSATVFSDRALVTREGSVTLSRGTHKFVFSNLTPGLVDESVRVSGKSTAGLKILDVQVELRYSADIQEKTDRTLQNKLDSLKAEDRLAADNIAIANSQKNFIESLQVETAKNISQNMTGQKPEVQDWQAMLAFINNGLKKVYAELRKQKDTRQEVREAIKGVEQELQKHRTLSRRSFKKIVVTIAVETPGNASLQTSYIVHDASWSPLYDARVSSQNKKLELTYYATIRQNTGEHWKDVALTLSTAQPLLTQALPELQSWFVDVKRPIRRIRPKRTHSPLFTVLNYGRMSRLRSGTGAIMGTIRDGETGDFLPGANVILKGTHHGAATDKNGIFKIENVPAGEYQLQVSLIGYRNINVTRVKIKQKHVTQIEASLPPEALEISELAIISAEPEAERELGHATADVHSSRISAVFELPTKSDIPSDDTPHKVTIAIEQLDVQFAYMTIPRITPKVFLEGKVVNSTAYPLLAGNVNVFFEDEFVNRTFLETIVRTDSFQLSLGIDEAIKVDRKLIKKFTESKGVFGGKRKITYEYEIHLTNNRPTAEEIRVSDQLPLSSNEKIKIRLLVPDEKQIKLDKLNRITWLVHLQPNETKILPFEYQIEFPESTTVYGLE